MHNIYQNLYQFSTYINSMDFTIHQYLLLSKPAILFATGTIKQAQLIIPQIKKLLNGHELKYVFVSHIESDECGGLQLFLKTYPNITTICSSLAARELIGYGYTGKLYTASPSNKLIDGNLSLQFIHYPSEVHLQNGVICFEENSSIFYSADLMLSFGNGIGAIKKENWTDAVGAIDNQRIPNVSQCKLLQHTLCELQPDFVAVGHGFCLDCL